MFFLVPLSLICLSNLRQALSMASWNSFPYEIKLHIAKDFVDIVLTRAAANILRWDYCYVSTAQVRALLVRKAKAQIRSLLRIEPDLGKDLLRYCRTRSWSEVATHDEQIIAQLVTAALEQMLSSDARVVA